MMFKQADESQQPATVNASGTLSQGAVLNTPKVPTSVTMHMTGSDSSANTTTGNDTATASTSTSTRTTSAVTYAIDAKTDTLLLYTPVIRVCSLVLYLTLTFLTFVTFDKFSYIYVIDKTCRNVTYIGKN